MAQEYSFELDAILKILPHRPPFLFVDRVKRLIPGKQIVTERTFLADEWFFKGHFPQKAIVPGVIVTDACAQTSGLLWGFTKQVTGGDTGKAPQIFFLAAANMKYTSPAGPGDTLEITAFAEKNFGTFFTYSVEALTKRKVVAKGSLTLAMVEGAL
jgi:3-hydroxymyristoyl/3-hydroxydecanoyl-(acyl carrier protein) dehydratase